MSGSVSGQEGLWPKRRAPAKQTGPSALKEARAGEDMKSGRCALGTKPKLKFYVLGWIEHLGRQRGTIFKFLLILY